MAKTEAKLSPPSALDANVLIALLRGTEVFLRDGFTTQLKEALESVHGEIQTHKFNGADTPVGEVLDECRSFGLMEAHKLVVVDDADQLVKEANRPLVERYAQNPSEGATLVLRSAKWNPGKLDEYIAESGVIVECELVKHDERTYVGRNGRTYSKAREEVEELERERAANWIHRRAQKRYDTELRKDAATLLVDRVGASLTRLDSELSKLAAAAGTGPITTALVTEFVGASREEEVWAIQAELLVGTPEDCLAHLRRMIDVSRHPTVLVSFAMVDLARKLHGAAEGLSQGMNPFSLAGKLKMWGPSKDLVLDAAKRVDARQAAELFDACLRADVAQKSGGGDPVRLLEALALRFASLRA